MSAPVRVAVFGNGFAARVQLPSLAKVGGNEVIGIAGRDPERARATAERFGIPRATTDYRELLDDRPDLVLVTTPVDLHAQMVRDALAAGAAVVCEKPFTMNVAEAEPLVEAAAGRLALIDHQLRWTPYRKKFDELVRAGAAGDLWHVRVHAAWGQPVHLTRPHTWWYEAERGGGILGAGASHLVDGVRHHFGEITSVRARLATYVAERSSDTGPKKVTADEHASLWLELASGVRATVDTDLILPGGPFLLTEAWGSAGVVRLEDEVRLTTCRHGEDPVEVDVDGGEYDVLDEELARYGAFGRAEPLFLRDVLATIAEDRNELPGAATFADGLACMKVLDAARASDANGTAVSCV
jgi:predicted dehydrogenase